MLDRQACYRLKSGEEEEGSTEGFRGWDIRMGYVASGTFSRSLKCTGNVVNF
jgi:hypothetical protein